MVEKVNDSLKDVSGGCDGVTEVKHWWKPVHFKKTMGMLVTVEEAEKYIGKDLIICYEGRYRQVTLTKIVHYGFTEAFNMGPYCYFNYDNGDGKGVREFNVDSRAIKMYSIIDRSLDLSAPNL